MGRSRCTATTCWRMTTRAERNRSNLKSMVASVMYVPVVISSALFYTFNWRVQRSAGSWSLPVQEICDRPVCCGARREPQREFPHCLGRLLGARRLARGMAEPLCFCFTCAPALDCMCFACVPAPDCMCFACVSAPDCMHVLGVARTGLHRCDDYRSPLHSKKGSGCCCRAKGRLLGSI